MLNEMQEDLADHVNDKPSKPERAPLRRSQRRISSQKNKKTFAIFCDDENEDNVS